MGLISKPELDEIIAGELGSSYGHYVRYIRSESPIGSWGGHRFRYSHVHVLISVHLQPLTEPMSASRPIVGS
jgi:hypothetical protein